MFVGAELQVNHRLVTRGQIFVGAQLQVNYRLATNSFISILCLTFFISLQDNHWYKLLESKMIFCATMIEISMALSLRTENKQPPIHDKMFLLKKSWKCLCFENVRKFWKKIMFMFMVLFFTQIQKMFAFLKFCSEF